MSGSESDQADLLSLGEHCSVEHCSQLDFLPFRCDCCQRIYCLEHRAYGAHQCPKAQGRSTEVIVCPLCAKGVRLTPGQDPNQAFHDHQASGTCNPEHYARVHKKPRCPAPNCKEKLTTINAYGCKQCGQRVCLKHRHPDDHACSAARAAKAQAAASTAQQRGLGGMLDRMQAAMRPRSASSSGPSSGASAGAGARSSAAAQDPANSLRGTAHRRMQAGAGGTTTPNPLLSTGAAPLSAAGSAAAGGQQAQQPRRPAPTSNANPLVQPPAREECPQCGARFASVERLIQHVEEYHPSQGPGSAPGARAGPGNPAALSASTLAAGAGAVAAGLQQGAGQLVASAGNLLGLGAGSGRSGNGAGVGQAAPGAGAGAGGRGSGLESCPFCSFQSSDPVALVGHVERCEVRRLQQQRGQAVGGPGTGSGGDNCCVQ